jgi:GT2 family glycosyltransferase
MNETVFVIIVNYNSGKSILETLRSVYASQGAVFEVIIVDNASTDGSLEKIRQHFSRSHSIVNPQNLGFAGGVNLGIRFALEKGAGAVFLLNPDATISPDTLAKLVETNKRCGRGVWSPIILSPNGSVWFENGTIDWLRMRVIHTPILLPQNNKLASHHNKKTSRIAVPEEVDTDFVSGCAMFIDKSVFKTTGIFDETFFLYYEDADFCVRAKKNGFPVRVATTITATHRELSEENKPRKTYWLVRSGRYFFAKHMPIHFRLWMHLFHIARKLRSAKKQKQNPNNPVIHAVYRGLRNLPYEN